AAGPANLSDNSLLRVAALASDVGVAHKLERGTDCLTRRPAVAVDVEVLADGVARVGAVGGPDLLPTGKILAVSVGHSQVVCPATAPGHPAIGLLNARQSAGEEAGGHHPDVLCPGIDMRQQPGKVRRVDVSGWCVRLVPDLPMVHPPGEV